MPVPRIDDIPKHHRRHGAGTRLWAEWCFIRVCFRHFRVRLAIMAAILLIGALLFIKLEPEKRHSLPQATFYTFSLIFGEPPEEFPTHPALQLLFFLVPILGLTVIIEGIVDFSLMLRDRRRMERSWCMTLSHSFRNHIVLVGFGRLGFHTFLLLRRMGEAVVVIERDAAGQFLEEVRRDGSPLLIGDARREALLEDANIRHAKSIILASDDDMANLEIALDARRFNPRIHVVTRMFDQNVADKIRDGFNIHLAMSQSAISAPTFASCALAPATINSFIVGGELVAMQRWLARAGDRFTGRAIADIMRREQVSIVSLTRAGAAQVLCPPAETVIEPGDDLMLQGEMRTLERFRLEAVEQEEHLTESLRAAAPSAS